MPSKTKVQIYPYLTPVLEGGGWSKPRPLTLYPRERARYILNEGGRSSRPVCLGPKILAPPRFEPGTPQTFTRRHKICAIPTSSGLTCVNNKGLRCWCDRVMRF
jgi:hypothetical protein